MAGLTVSGEAVPTALHETLRAGAPVWFSGAGEVLDVRLEASRRLAYSTVSRWQIRFAGGSQASVVVKAFPDAEVQFLALRAVWPAFADQHRWRVPRPLALLGAGPALVMTAVEGPTLPERLPRWCPRLPSGKTQADCVRVAGWLRFYHDATSAGQARLDTSVRIADAANAVARLAALGVTGGWTDDIRRVLDRLGPTLDGQALPAARVHGEFTADNVVVTDDAVGALDLWGRDENAVHHDVASFLNSLWLMRLTRPGLGPGAVAALGRAFTGAYFGPRPSALDRRAAAFLQIAGLVDAALEIAGRRRSRLARAWLARVIGGAVAWLCSTEDLA
jgi:hypothetical protein